MSIFTLTFRITSATNTDVRINRFTPLAMLSVLVLAALSAVSQACQEIRLSAADESIVLGRSMEFSMPFDTYFYSEPEGMEATYPELANCPGNAQTFANRFKVGYIGRHEVCVRLSTSIVINFPC